VTPDDRRPFRGAPFERGRNDRPSGPDRGDRPPGGDRPPYGAGPPRPFTRPVTRGGDLPAPQHSVRLRDGERELEVSGAPAFVRQILDDLPVLLGRLRGEPTGRTAISMPAPPAARPVVDHVPTTAVPDRPAAAVPEPAASNGHGPDTPSTPGNVEDEVFAVLRSSSLPLAVAAIRELMPSAVSGQQVRRILEKAETRVKVSTDRPATYSLR
jgi:hypothetical protein